jgi:hypothetical protein
VQQHHQRRAARPALAGQITSRTRNNKPLAHNGILATHPGHGNALCAPRSGGTRRPGQHLPRAHRTVPAYPARHGFAVPDNPTYDSQADARHWDALGALYEAHLHVR